MWTSLEYYFPYNCFTLCHCGFLHFRDSLKYYFSFWQFNTSLIAFIKLQMRVNFKSRLYFSLLESKLLILSNFFHLLFLQFYCSRHVILLIQTFYFSLFSSIMSTHAVISYILKSLILK